MSRSKAFEAKVEFVRYNISFVPGWALEALLYVTWNQTEVEFTAETSIGRNHVGFNKWDARILTRVYNKFMATGILTDRQATCIQTKMWKYAGQLVTALPEDFWERKLQVA